MLSKMTNLKRNIMISLIMYVATFIGFKFMSSSSLVSSMWPAAGFAVAYYLFFGKKILPGMMIGVFLSQLINSVFHVHIALPEALLTSLVFASATVLEAIIFRFIFLSLYKKSYPMSLITIIVFFAFTISALIGSLYCTLFLMLKTTNIQFIDVAFRWFVGDLSGMMIFGSVTLLSMRLDETGPAMKHGILISGVFLILFSVFSYVIFSELIIGFSYATFEYIFIAFFIFSAFFFQYRVLIALDALFVIAFQFFYLPTLQVDVLAETFFILNLFLFFISSTTAILKKSLYEIKSKSELLQNSNRKLEKMIDSTNQLYFLTYDLLYKNTMITENHLKKMFQIAVNTFENFDYASCFVNDNGNIHFIDTFGYEVDKLNNQFSGFDGFVWNFSNPVIFRNAEERIKAELKDRYKEYAKDNLPIKESIQFSIHIRDRVVGGMSFDLLQSNKNIFADVDLRNFLAFQKLMNGFFQINTSYSKSIKFKSEISLSLIRALEAYDTYTKGHSEDVAYLAEQIAIKMKLTNKEIDDIYWAGIVHDIGKIGISTDILHKEGKLTSDEYDLVKMHCEAGFKILSDSQDLQNIAKIILHHHERWDGMGYPYKLSQEAIPLGSQILAVADSVSAMSSFRSYSKIKSSEEIITELNYCLEKQFSPIPAKFMIEFIQAGKLDEYYKTKAKNLALETLNS